MKIYDVYSEEFRDYGKVVEGLDTSALLEKLDSVSPCPEDGTVYVPSSAELEALPVYSWLSDHVYGGMPIQIGYCSGTNTKLNCLEYHRGSEVNVAPGSFVLLLARVQDIRDGKIDSSAVKAFRVPAGVMRQSRRSRQRRGKMDFSLPLINGCLLILIPARLRPTHMSVLRAEI